MIKIEYDNTIEEIETAFMLFWSRYSLTRTFLFSVVFAISAGLFVNMAVNSGGSGITMPIGGIGTGLSLALLANLWLKPRRAKKKLSQALSLMGEERYSAEFGERQIEIQTIAVVEPSEPDSEQEDSGESAEPERSTSTYNIATEELYSRETPLMFVLFVNRGLIYLFPKRCLSEQQIAQLREYFVAKNI